MQSSGLLPVQVRTPLNGCLASAEMLLETSLGAEQRELARTIRVSGSILLSTVSNFLDFFKLEAGKPLDVVRREINVQVSSRRGVSSSYKKAVSQRCHGLFRAEGKGPAQRAMIWAAQHKPLYFVSHTM